LTTLLIAIPALTVALCLPLAAPSGEAKLMQRMRMSAILCALMRLPLSVDLPPVRLFASIGVMGLAGLYLATVLHTAPLLLPRALAVGAFVDQVLRALGNTYDPSLRTIWLAPQIVLSAGLILLAIRLARQKEPLVSEPGSIWAGISVGGSLFLISSLFGLPGAAARWTESGYPVMAIGLLPLATLPLWPQTARIRNAQWLRVLLLFIVGLGLALADGLTGVLAAVALLASVAAFWLLLPGSLVQTGSRTRLGLTLGLVLLLLFGVAHAFSYTYAYTISAFRGLGLPTFLLAVALTLGPSLAPKPKVAMEPAHMAWQWTAVGLVAKGLAIGQ